MPTRPLPISLDRTQPSPVYRQIYERIRNAILAGTLAPGTRLPSWNGLASQLGVARGTVKAAYDWLAGEGYVLGRGAAGTIVPPIFRTPLLAQATGAARLGSPPQALDRGGRLLRGIQPDGAPDVGFEQPG